MNPHVTHLRRASFMLLVGVIVWCAAASATHAAPNAHAVYNSATHVHHYPKQIPPPSSNGAPGAGDGDQTQALAPHWTFTRNIRPHPQESGQHIWPDIAVGPGRVVAVAWMDDHLSSQYHIFYSASTDGGQTWSAPEQVDDRTSGSYSKFVSFAFTPSGIPVAVWEDDRGGAYNVYLSKRDPAHGGTPWTPSKRVNTAGSPPSSSDFMDASLAVLDDNRYFVAWTDWREGVFNQVYFRATRDGGATWSAESRISDEQGYEPVAATPCLIVDPTSGGPGTETLYCVMNDWRGDVPGGRYPNVYFSRSTDGGASWSRGVQVNDLDLYFQQVSSHALVLNPDGTLTSGWLNDQFAGSQFRACVSTDKGATWSPSVQVNDPARGSTGTYSSIAGVDGVVFAGFDVYTSSWDSYFRASSDGGRTWTQPQVRMDDDTTGSATGNTVVAAAQRRLAFGAWSDTRPSYGAWQIYTTRGRLVR
jgi:hypothetical protein